MITNIYTIRDTVAKDCAPLWEAVNDDVAKRNFKNLLKDNPSKADFLLYRVGTFHREKMLITSNEYEVVVMDWEGPMMELKGVVNGK